MSDFYSGFLRDLGGLAILVVVLGFLFKQLLEHQLTRQMATLQAGISRMNDVLSRRNEREFAVTEEAWVRMNKAVGTAVVELGNSAHGKGFARMENGEALRVVDNLPFSDEEKVELRSLDGSERDEFHRKCAVRHAIQASLEQWYEFKDWLNARQIFLEPTIFGSFIGVSEELNNVFAHARVYDMPGHTIPLPDLVEMNRFLRNDLEQKIRALGAMIQTRFLFTTAGT